MNELAAVLAEAEAAAARREPVVLATVVRVVGSSYRRPGARLVLNVDGRFVGCVSGGCLEADLVRKAWWRTEEGTALLRYDTSPDDDDQVGLGCGGVIEILLERLPETSDNGHLSHLRRWREGRRPGVLARVIASRGGAGVPLGAFLAVDSKGNVAGDLAGHPTLEGQITPDAMDCLERSMSRIARYGRPGSEVDVFLEVVRAPTSLWVCGTGVDVIPVVRIAKEVGWEVTVVDHRGRADLADRFPVADRVLALSPEDLPPRLRLESCSALVIMTHHFPTDLRILNAVAGSAVPDLGVLGSRERFGRLLERLEPGMHDPCGLSKIHAPVGLDLGSETPAEIALAIIAEVQAARNGRPGSCLKDRDPEQSPGDAIDRDRVKSCRASTASCSLAS